MAYNLQSLITILKQILDPEQTRWIVNQNKPQLESILEKTESLQQLLHKCPLTKVARSNLERRIRDAAYRAEDVIESRMVHQMLSAPQGADRSLLLFTFFTPYLQQVKQQLDLQQDLERVTQELDIATQQVVELMEGTMMLGGSGPTPDHLQQSVKLVELEEKKMLARGRLSSAKNHLVGVNEHLLKLRLLRVLDVLRVVFKEFPGEILQLANLRYLAFSCTSGLPIELSRLWYLQTLIFPLYVPYVPSDLWELSELRHVKFSAKFKIKEAKFIHKKLQTLSCVLVVPSLIRSGFFETIPNIRKLGIYCEGSPEIEVDLSHLHKLEKLKCEGSRFLHKIRVPCNLGKLTLVGCVVFQSLLTTLCALPNLKVLKIMFCVFESEAEKVWELTEVDEFSSLQYLCLKSLNLVCWKADKANFPRLRELIVDRCYELEEIPSAIGEIPTLKEISIYECGDSVVASAKQIRKVQQEEHNNYGLKVSITY
ncbi:hypothetical protein SASPL_153579 [Salvia splendens]|uniref:Disease resistance R13L4/SHOC-2-like LRR domain-containing protein n=1 Tax=Salvia splendens TaxID=180675 RepID=A0A8X8YXP0_SALSN|nr:hypothetical protein SASPL_153579 [Salvia splendens]